MKVAFSANYFDELARLSNAIQAQTTRTMLKFKCNPLSPTFDFENVENSSGFFSLNVSEDYLAIAKKGNNGDLLVFVHIDKQLDAHRWAETHHCEINPISGIVQVYSDVQMGDGEQSFLSSSDQTKGVFSTLTERELETLGVPSMLIPRVFASQNEKDFDTLENVLPDDAYESLFYFLCGESYENLVVEREKESQKIDTLDFDRALKRDGSRGRFVVVENDFELESHLNEPLAKWRVFLHPMQRELVERTWNGPVRVFGSAGTGKTVVALHRAKYLATRLSQDSKKRSSDRSKRILFVTYVSTLVTDIKQNLKFICTPEEFKLIEVIHIDEWLIRFIKKEGFDGQVTFGLDSELWNAALLKKPPELDLAETFYEQELRAVVLAKNVQTRSEYMTVPRIGQGSGLTRRERVLIWPVFDSYLTSLRRLDKKTDAQLYFEAISIIERERTPNYEHVIVDEVQDFEDYKLWLLRKLVSERENDMFLVGDSKQRIFLKKPVVLAHCGINIRGRGSQLRVNYRTTREIERFASDVLGTNNYDDLDGNVEIKSSIKSMTKGPDPQIENYREADAHWDALVERVRTLLDQDVPARSICVVVRTNHIRTETAIILKQSNIPVKELLPGIKDEADEDQVRVCTAHRVKGLEFDYVYLACCNHELYPLKSVLEQVNDDEREQKITLERSLLYVAASRAKRELIVLSYGEPSVLLSQSVVSASQRDFKEN